MFLAAVLGLVDVDLLELQYLDFKSIYLHPAIYTHMSNMIL